MDGESKGRRRRASWPIALVTTEAAARAVVLGDAQARLAALAELSEAAWALAGVEPVTLPRHVLPVRLSRLREQRPGR